MNVSPLIFVENVPEELREPFYTDQYDQEHIKPPVVGLLLSAELLLQRPGSLILRRAICEACWAMAWPSSGLSSEGPLCHRPREAGDGRDLHKKPIQMVRLRGRAGRM